MGVPKGLLKSDQVQNFLSLPGERIIIAKRKHWFVLVGPITAVFLFASFFLALSFFAFIYNFSYPGLFITSMLIGGATVSSITLKIIADWYYHIYIVTSRKIVEVTASPLFSYALNDVLLDQVRITEIDVKIKNIFYELMDMGDVRVIFDRPSHEEMIVFSNIKDPDETGLFLAHECKVLMEGAPIWFQPKTRQDVYKFTEDVFTTPSVASH